MAEPLRVPPYGSLNQLITPLLAIIMDVDKWILDVDIKIVSTIFKSWLSNCIKITNVAITLYNLFEAKYFWAVIGIGFTLIGMGITGGAAIVATASAGVVVVFEFIQILAIALTIQGILDEVQCSGHGVFECGNFPFFHCGCRYD